MSKMRIWRCIKRLLGVASLLCIGCSGGCISYYQAFVARCTIMLYPKNLKPISLETIGPVTDNLSVMLINKQLNYDDEILEFYTSDYIGRPSGHYFGNPPPLFQKHTICANYRDWTEQFILYWSEEMRKRGIFVGSESQNRISVLLGDFHHGDDPSSIFRVKAQAKLTLSNADETWTKEFEGTGTSRWTKLAAYEDLMQVLVQKLLRDKEVLDHMKRIVERR